MQKVLIIDSGSQYTQLIARRVREQQVYCEIHPFHTAPAPDADTIGVIFSGSPASVHDANAPQLTVDQYAHLPILGVCYGAQYLAQVNGGAVIRSQIREYGRAHLKSVDSTCPLFKHIPAGSQVWMSHGDTIGTLPAGTKVVASTDHVENAAYVFEGKPHYAIQFHPEVTHSLDGKQLIENFLVEICGAHRDWTSENYIDATLQQLKDQVGSDTVVMGLSGGVDSTVAATLLSRAIGNQLVCIFIDNGLLRKDEYEAVLESYKNQGLNIIGVDAKQRFYDALTGISDPEQKRKTIGRVFIEVFDEEANKIDGARWLGQGTIYPDVIESMTVHGPSATIKSHHNVGGLPEDMKLKVVEPLRSLFKDEVRLVGRALGLPNTLLGRHPFPGPGLAIRILGDITADKVRILQEADAIFIQNLKDSNWYDKVWQAGAIFLPVQSVGVMGDERTYEHVICLRAVQSVDGMTADWSHLPYELLGKISNEIINQVKGINRVVYDISSKPPATIEWE